MRLIDAEFEANHYASMLLDPTPDVTEADKKNAKAIIDALELAGTVDAVQVVRCKDCRFYSDLAECVLIGDSMGTNGFCSWAERKEADV